MVLWSWVTPVAAAATAAVVMSWRGARKLRHRHMRSAVAEEPQPGPEGQQKVAVILNPVKAQAEDAEKAIRELVQEAAWPEPLILYTTAEDPGESQAQQALDWGADVVLVGGGDGTVRMVSSVLKNTATALALIPLGTGNLLARNLDMKVNDLHGSVRIGLFGRERHIDTATMHIVEAETGDVSENTFLVIAGIGVDAQMINDTSDTLKRSLGWIAYSGAGMRHLAGLRKNVAISLDGGPEQNRRVRSVLFCNCGLLPGGIDFVPGALIDDGVLDIVVMSPRSAVGWLAMSIKVLLRHSRKLPVIDFYRTQQTVVRSPKPQATQLDGDPAPVASKVSVRVIPKSLLVRVS